MDRGDIVKTICQHVLLDYLGIDETAETRMSGVESGVVPVGRGDREDKPDIFVTSW